MVDKTDIPFSSAEVPFSDEVSISSSPTALSDERDFFSPSEEMEETLAARTPDTDTIARLNEEMGEDLGEIDSDELKTLRRVKEVFPTRAIAAFDSSSANLRQQLMENSHLLEKEDIESVTTAAKEIKNIQEKGPKEYVGNLVDVAAGAYSSTAEAQRLADKARILVDRRAEGEIDDELFKIYTEEIRLETEENQKDIEQLKETLIDMGWGGDIIKDVGNLAPSQVRILRDALAGRATGWVAKRAAGMVVTGGDKALSWLPSVLSTFAAGRAAYHLEAGGIAHDLLLTRDARGRPIPVDRIRFFSKLGGAFSGSLEFVGAAGIAAGTGLGGLLTTKRFKDAVKRMATSPILQNRILKATGAISFATAGEVITENLQEIVTSSASEMAKNPKADMAEIVVAQIEAHKEKFAELTKATAQGTAVLTAVTRAVLGGGSAVHRRLTRKRVEKEIRDNAVIQMITAQEDSSSLRKAVEAVKKSPLAKGHPEKVESMLGEGRKSVYIPASSLKEYFDTAEVDAPAEIAKMFGESVAEDYETALANGGDIKVPAAVAVVELAANPDQGFSDAVYKNARFSPDNMTETEAVTAVKTAFKAEEAAKAEGEAQEGTPSNFKQKYRNETFEAIKKAQLETGSYNFEAASHTADIFAEAMDATANLLGMDLETYLEEMGPELIFDPTAKKGTGGYSAFRPWEGRSPLIALTKGSTKARGGKPSQSVTTIYIHEMGHHILSSIAKTYNRLAGQGKKDADAILSWLKIDPEILKRRIEGRQERLVDSPQHEAFAENMERFFREGKAPNKKLAPIFGRIAQWQLQVYKFDEDIRIQNRSRSSSAMLDDDMREIFDRLLSVDAEIRGDIQSQREFHMELLNYGIPDELAQKIAEKREVMITDYISKAMVGAKRKKRDSAVQEFLDDYEDLAYDTLVKGRPLPNGQRVQVNIRKIPFQASLLNVIHLWRKVLSPDGSPAYVETGGVSPDEAAKILGFEDGVDLGNHLLEYENRKRQAAEDFAQENLEPAPTAAEDQRRLEKVNEELSLKLALWEYRVLSTEGKKVFLLDEIQQDPEFQSLQTMADNHIEGRTIEETDVGKIYHAAALRWANVALDATDKKAILEAKRYQAYNQAFYSSAMKMVRLADEIENDAERILEIARRTDDSVVSDKVARVGKRYIVAHGLTDEARASIVKAQQGQRTIHEMKPAELRNVSSKLKTLIRSYDIAVKDSDGRIEQEREVLIDELVKDTEEVKKGRPAPDRPKGPFRDDGLKEKINRLRRRKANFEMLLHKPEFMLLMMDLSKYQGKWWRAIYQPIDRARSDYLKESGTVRKRFEEIVLKHYSKDELRRFGDKTIQHNGRLISRQEAVAVLLNYGNREGRDRLASEDNGVGDPEAMQIFSQLNENDFKYAEEVWSYLSSFWNRISDLEVETVGKPPVIVDPVPFEVNGRKLKGGYYPLRYLDEALHERLSARGINPEELINEDTFNGSHPQTEQGHVKKRAKDVNLELNLDLTVPLKHLDRVIYDLHFRRPVLEVAGVLRSPRVAQSLDEGIGTGAHEAFVQWLKSVARDVTLDTRPPTRNMQRAYQVLGALRKNTTFALMGHSFRVTLLQPLGLFVTAERYGGRNVVRTMFNMVTSQKHWKQLQAMRELSPFMKERATTFERDPYEYMKERFPGISWGLKGSLDFAQRNAFYLIGQADLFTSGVSWMTAFDQATGGKVEGVDPLDMEAAVAHADQSVRLTQGSGGRIDLSIVQANSELSKLFTMFYGYFNTVFNRRTEIRRQRKRGDLTALQAARSAVYLWVMVGVMEELMLGEAPEDEEPEDAIYRYGLAVLQNYLGMYPIVREIGGALEGFESQGSPVVSMGNSATKAFMASFKVFQPDAEFTRADRKNAINTAGLFLGIPSAQLNRGMDAIMLLSEDPNISVVDALRVITRGASKKERESL